MKKNKKGYSLPELLVVISIIGILSTVVFFNVSSIRMKARDSKRIADLNAIVTAMKMYKDDKGTYVIPGVGSNGTGSGMFNANSSNTTDSTYSSLKSIGEQLVSSGYLQQLLQDPSGNVIQDGSKTKHPYMVYVYRKDKNDNNYFVSPSFGNAAGPEMIYAYANLEKPSDSQLQSITKYHTCGDDNNRSSVSKCTSTYGMNVAVTVKQ